MAGATRNNGGSRHRTEATSGSITGARDDAEGEKVAARAGFPALDLLGRHVGQRAQDSAFAG